MDHKQDWFERWPKPGGSADCPAESKLVEWASQPASPESELHLSQCRHCAEIVQLLGRTKDRSSDGLRAFMTEVRSRAQEQVGHRIPLWRSGLNYVLASPARAIGAVAGLGALALILTSGAWRHIGVFEPPPQTQTVQMDADKNEQVYASAMEKMHRSYAVVSSDTATRDQVTEQINEFDKSLSGIDRNRLGPDQRSQLDRLEAQFHAEVGLKGTEKQLTKVQQVSETDFEMPKGRKSAKGALASTDWRATYDGSKIQMNGNPATTPVEVTFKPNPIYTDEARNLKLEGEVLLQVQFLSDGSLHVDHVIRGLGHGLDEAAIAAANRMRFKPATRDGQPVDSVAVVHVVFQLAY
jgi:TonB family protein